MNYRDNEIKNSKSAVIVMLILLLSVIMFYVVMTSSNRAKPINTSSIIVYKNEIKKEFSGINKVNVYYRFGRIIFDFNVNSSMATDEYKSVVKKTKEFIIKEGATNLLPKGYDDQASIRVEFNTKESSYSFEIPYWIPTEDTTDNPNNMVENNYKVWYFNINNEPQTEIQF